MNGENWRPEVEALGGNLTKLRRSGRGAALNIAATYLTFITNKSILLFPIVSKALCYDYGVISRGSDEILEPCSVIMRTFAYYLSP